METIDKNNDGDVGIVAHIVLIDATPLTHGSREHPRPRLIPIRNGCYQSPEIETMGLGIHHTSQSNPRPSLDSKRNNFYSETTIWVNREWMNEWIVKQSKL